MSTNTRPITVILDAKCFCGQIPLIWGAAAGRSDRAERIARRDAAQYIDERAYDRAMVAVVIQWERGALPTGQNVKAIDAAIAAHEAANA